MEPRKVCRSCEEPVGPFARSCRRCGEPHAVERRDPRLPERGIEVAAEFAVAAGVLLALGPFLPFAEAGRYAAAGLGKVGIEVLAVLCSGAVVAALGIAGVVFRRRYPTVFLPCAAAAALVTLYYHLSVRDHLLDSRHYSAEIGLGIAFCYLGAAFAFLAGATCLVRRPDIVTRVRLSMAAESLHETAFRARPFLLSASRRGERLSWRLLALAERGIQRFAAWRERLERP